MSQTALAKSPSSTTPETPIDSTPAATPTPRSSPFRKIIVFGLLAAGLGWAVHYAQHLLTHAETDNAYITGYVHQVNAHIGGTVTEVLVDQNTEVKAGDVLFRLDPRDNEAKLRQTEAQLEQSNSMIAFAKAEAADAKAKVDQAQAQLTKAQLDFDRVKELTRTKVASKQEFDAAQATFDSASASLASAKATAQAMASGMHLAEAQFANSQTSVDNAKLQLSYCTIVAPVSGLTSKRSAEVGSYAQPGQTLLAVVQPEVWIEANFKETQLAKMKAGQTAEITIDALPGHTFIGHVESFSPASGAQFAMLPPDNATGNFTKVVQRVPVRVRFDANSVREFADRLRPGLSAVVSVDLK